MSRSRQHSRDEMNEEAHHISFQDHRSKRHEMNQTPEEWALQDPMARGDELKNRRDYSVRGKQKAA